MSEGYMQKNTIRVNFKALPPKGMNIHGNEAQRLGGGGGGDCRGKEGGQWAWGRTVFQEYLQYLLSKKEQWKGQR